MGWREVYRNMPRHLSLHAKEQFFTRATSLSLGEQQTLIRNIIRGAKLTAIKKRGNKFQCIFQFDGWSAVGQPRGKQMYIVTIFPTVH